MEFQPGKSGNPAGRPPGSREKVTIPVRTQKAIIKILTERALQGDTACLESLALMIVSQNREESLEEFK